MSDIINLYNLVSDFLDRKITMDDERFNEHITNIFNMTEVIIKNYFNMFSQIRIGIISGKLSIQDIIDYLLEREYEMKDTRILVRNFLKDKYYQDNDERVKFVAAIYGVLECYPVKKGMIVDKTNHTLNSYIKFCKTLQFENDTIQKSKILNMTNCVLNDLTTSWETVCMCYVKMKDKKK